MARTIGNVNICRSGIVLETITIVMTIVSNPEFLLFEGLVPHRFWKGHNSRETMRYSSRHPNLDTQTSGE